MKSFSFLTPWLIKNLSINCVFRHDVTFPLLGHDRNRFLVEDDVFGGQDGAPPALGHRGPGEIQVSLIFSSSIALNA